MRYGFSEFESDVKILAKELMGSWRPDAIVGVARGGMSLAHFLSIALNTRNCFSLNSIHYDDRQKLDFIKIFNVPDLSSFKRVLVVDDIVDSGETMSAIMELLKRDFSGDFKSLSIFYKKSAIYTPDFSLREASEWVEFCWDIEI